MNNNTNAWRLRKLLGQVPAHDASAQGRYMFDLFAAMPPEMRAQLQAEAAAIRRAMPESMTDEERAAHEKQQTEWFASISHDERERVHHEAVAQRRRDRVSRE